jgi:hypothetical protein
VGVATATVLTAFAGARRTSSLFDRYLKATRVHDAWLDFQGNTKVDPTLLDRIEALPQVETFALLAAVAVLPKDNYVPLLATIDGRYGVTVDRFPIVAGRQADPRAANEVMLSEDVSRRLHAPVGSRVTFGSYAPDQKDALASSNNRRVPFGGPDFTLTVVGVVRTGSDLASRPGDITVSVVTPAFYEQNHDRILINNLNAVVRLRGGASAVTAFSAAVRALTADEAAVSIEPTDTGVAEGLHDGFRVLSDGLLVFATVAGAAALVALATVLGRRALVATTDDPILAAIGMNKRQRGLAAGGLVVPAAFGGAVLGAFGAFASSTFMPVGIARRAEPRRGFDADWPVLVLGALTVTVLVAAIALVASWRHAHRATAHLAPPHPRVAPAVGRGLTALGPVASVGARMAFEPGRGRTAVPVRPAVLGSVVGIGAVLAALGLSASLDRLVTTPARYGAGWDIAIVQSNPDINVLAHNRDLAAIGVGRFHVPLVLDGRPTFAIGLESRLGEISPTVLAGRPARSASEIVLGTDTLARIHRNVGDTVTADGPAGTRRLQVVGRGVFSSPDDPLPLADGAELSLAGLNTLGLADGSHEDQSYVQYLVKWAPSVDVNAAKARLAAQYQVITPRPPPEVQKLTQVQALPRVLAGFLASIAVLAMGYALVTGVTRRRRDFAVLRTIGFTGRQVSATVAWQASTISALGVAAGIPLGLVIGRTIWAHVAAGLGVATDTAVPTLALLVAVPVALFGANLIAFVPGRVAARTQPANALRSE